MGTGDADAQKTFIEDVVPWLEDQDFIERYAAFGESPCRLKFSALAGRPPKARRSFYLHITTRAYARLELTAFFPRCPPANSILASQLPPSGCFADNPIANFVDTSGVLLPLGQAYSDTT